MATLAGKDPTVSESMDNDLKTLTPEQQFVEIDGDKIYVKEFTFSRMMKAVKHINNLISSIDENLSTERNILKAFAEHGDDVLNIISLATDLPLEFFDLIGADKGVELAILTYKVNESFFVQDILPKINDLFQPADSPEETESQTKPVEKVKKAGLTSAKS